MSSRAAALAQLLEARQLDALLVEGPANLRYLTGFTGSHGLALVRADARGRFLTDFRYQTQAAQEIDVAFEREIIPGDLLEALAAGLSEGERIGFDDASMSVRRRQRLGELAPGCEIVAASGLPEQLRMVKDEEEQRRISAAAQLVDEIYARLLERGLAGRSEREVALELEHQMRLAGASGPSFPSIVAGGAHGALPHAQPREVALERGSLVTIDIGALLDGYCSDCTRTFAVGEPSEQAREVYEVVLAAQQAGLDAVRPGILGREVDAVARAVIDDAGYGDYFGHGLGHGVGLEIHEAPRLSRTAGDRILEAGNVVTVEPGIYLPDRLGVRIEDLVVVDGEGARRLSTFPKELLIAD